MDPIALIQDGADDRWLRFAEPVAVLAAFRVDEVQPAIAELVERVEREGLFAAGFLAYEAAPAFDPALAVHPGASASALPLAWFALFRRAEAIAEPFAVPDGAPGDSAAGYSLGTWRPSLDETGYRRAFAAIKRLIARGETYQVNFTYRLRSSFRGDPAALCRDLVAAQRPRYAAYLDLGRFAVCSASPELFFHLDGRRLEARPMKGTAHRDLTAAADAEGARRLRGSAKERAENLMIVDMLRNDLGRVAAPGSVSVPELFAVERYPTVLQMTSTVTAESAAPLPAILAALFPCASITGAPKARTSEIIARLEDGPRGVYTGAVGYLAPGRRARFNVAIRTAMVDRERGEVAYGVGGGIVWDSAAAVERRECELKARVLTAALRRPWPEFELLETMRWTPGEGFAHGAEHLARLAGSAEYFGFPLDAAELRARLDAFSGEGGEGSGAALRVRLLVDRRGGIRLEASALGEVGGEGPAADDAVGAPAGRPLRVALAPAPVDPDDPFLYHKTTVRARYDEALAARPDCDEVLLWNPRGELTEACTANLVLRLDGEWVTPPVACGLLPGILRDALLAAGRVRERVVAVADLDRADALYLVSSLRGWRGASIGIGGASSASATRYVNTIRTPAISTEAVITSPKLA
jgi:para-aminobenzoate synthetase / 4-amino-4-deoxychorismate lyase